MRLKLFHFLRQEQTQYLDDIANCTKSCWIDRAVLWCNRYYIASWRYSLETQLRIVDVTQELWVHTHSLVCWISNVVITHQFVFPTESIRTSHWNELRWSERVLLWKASTQHETRIAWLYYLKSEAWSLCNFQMGLSLTCRHQKVPINCRSIQSFRRDWWMHIDICTEKPTLFQKVWM